MNLNEKNKEEKRPRKKPDMTRVNRKKALQTLRRKKRFLAELVECLGIVSDACKAIGISRQQFYEWKEKDPEFAKAVVDVNEEVIDYVEGRLLSSIKGTGPGAVTAQIFYLKCRAKIRGYVERVELGGHDGQPMKFEIVSNVPRPDYSRPVHPAVHPPHEVGAAPAVPEKDPEFTF